MASVRHLSYNKSRTFGGRWSGASGDCDWGNAVAAVASDDPRNSRRRISLSLHPSVPLSKGLRAAKKISTRNIPAPENFCLDHKSARARARHHLGQCGAPATLALVVARLAWSPKPELATGCRRIARRPVLPEGPRTVARGWCHNPAISAIAEPAPKTPCVVWPSGRNRRNCACYRRSDLR